MDPSLITSSLQSTFDSLGITELTGLFITITAMSGSFYFILGIIGPPMRAAWEHLQQLTFFELSVYVADPDFQKFNTWLNKQQKYTWFQRTYKVVNADDNNQYEHRITVEEGDSKNQSKLSPGYGSVLIKSPGHPLVLATRTKVENKNVYKETEILTFKIFSFNRAKINKFFAEVVGADADKGPVVYSYENDWWQEIGKTKSVLSPLGKSSQEFIDDVDYFLKSEEEYRTRGISYKRGYLLYGLPGTGKTSIIAHLSKIYRMNIYCLSSSTIAGFHKCAGDIKPRSIILIEDIDMTVAGQSKRKLEVKAEPLVKKATRGHLVEDKKTEIEEEEEEYIEILTKEAMREFLNTLDGITEFEGHLVIATTNKRDVLDEALLRPGRIDRHIEIELFTYVEQIQHVNRFYGVHLDPENYSYVQDRTFAVLQDLCVNNLNDYRELVKLL